jgi:hypothetical protein
MSTSLLRDVRALVCGGRDFGASNTTRGEPKSEGLWRAERAFLYATLDRVHRERTIACVIAGGRYHTDDPDARAKGADWFALSWAVVGGVPYEEYPADWPRYRNAAGPIRNAEMLVRGRPDVVIAFPGGRGTAHMTRIAAEAGVPVYRPTWSPPCTATSSASS